MLVNIAVVVGIEAETPQEAYNVLCAALGEVAEGRIGGDDGRPVGIDWHTIGYDATETGHAVEDLEEFAADLLSDPSDLFPSMED